MRWMETFLLLAVTLGMTGCAVRAVAGPPPVGSRVMPAMTNNWVVGEVVKIHGRPRRLTPLELTSLHASVAANLQRQTVAQALDQGKPVALLIDAAADGTEGGREIMLFRQLKAQFGRQIAFIYVDPFRDAAFVRPWHVPQAHAVFLIDARGVITYEYVGAWGLDNVLPALRRLAATA